ncbi:uncharacterized protein VTP21DRAFT_9333 [Calcarisporiella thermophila]|uniref:uncharacterized protein n=1 Tax=Calcarisporiella thermophila TaxID=911321 RepID=UPI0037430C87
MFSAIKAAVLALAVAQLALAQAPPKNAECPSITTPIEGTVWKLGEKATINWTPAGKEEKVNLFLRKGPAQAMLQVAPIQAKVDVKAKTLTWTVPTTLTPGADYSVEIGVAPALCYSHYFTIQKGNEKVTASAPAASSEAAASSAPASASASASKPATAVSSAAVSGASSVVSSSVAASSSAAPSSSAAASAASSAASSAAASGAAKASSSAAPSASVKPASTSGASSLKSGTALLAAVAAAAYFL